MYYTDGVGNVGPKKPLWQLKSENQKSIKQDISVGEIPIGKPAEAVNTEANSLDALSNYGLALSGLGKKADVSYLGLSPNDQAIVGRYVTQEQQARISEDMLTYFT